MREAMYYEKLSDNKIKCQLCPQFCIIDEGQTGICWGKQNIDGKLYAVNYGKTISFNMDPIEKKPLYHFYPGRDILSIGPNGCNLRCKFCQNYHISQQRSYTDEITSEDLVRDCERYNSIGVAYTYTEPLIWYEFILDSAKLLHQHNRKVVLVTNGMINEEPLRELLPYVDAMNIDLKSIRDEFYRKYCGGKLEPVKNTIRVANEQTHIEVTNLIITNLNDTMDEIQELIDFVANIDTKIPLHFSRYYPAYKIDEPPTSPEILKMAYDMAKEKLDYVYLGNIYINGTDDTRCPECDNLLIKRAGFSAQVVGLDKNGRCGKCGKEIKGIRV